MFLGGFNVFIKYCSNAHDKNQKSFFIPIVTTNLIFFDSAESLIDDDLTK
jgi:hypothetical protein